jgi:hypothetical protein
LSMRSSPNCSCVKDDTEVEASSSGLQTIKLQLIAALLAIYCKC